MVNVTPQGQWGHTEELLEEWLHWFDGAYFDPTLAFLGLDPIGRPAGICMCTIYPERNEQLGRALLLEGMRALRLRGCTHLVLGVDSDNPTGALRLYESVGFREWRTRVTFRKVLRE